MAAVSARRTCRPRRTRGRPAARSAAPTRPRGPTSTVGWRKRRRRRRRGRRARRPAAPATSANVADAGSTSGSHVRRHCMAACAGDVGQPVGLARRPWPRPTARRERSATNGTMRSTPSSVSFCTASSGRSPLTSANATVIGGRRPGVDHDVAGRLEVRAGGQPRRPPAPAPSPTVTGSPGAQPQDPRQVVVVAARQARARRGRRRTHGRAP